ncbi:Hypothetical predicted protein [Octopus vulgaris]|uniref:Uncharacterized protein n=1 Tax=Octopus vulgaris TaxID=6645 RepID=A0AA36BCJ0_OCTVU|nr:Hypothetical predicted protein [Octopus vulgaris]
MVRVENRVIGVESREKSRREEPRNVDWDEQERYTVNPDTVEGEILTWVNCIQSHTMCTKGNKVSQQNHSLPPNICIVFDLLISTLLH